MALAPLAIPWAIFPLAQSGTRLDALGFGALASGLWPVLLGGVFFAGVWRWGSRLPAVPEGDIVIAGEAPARATIAWGDAVERADSWLRQWPVTCLSFLSLAILPGDAMLAWR
jgi:hypothetical protein